MGLELIAAIVLGVAAAGIAHLARRLSRGRLPAWIVPAAAAVAMVGFSIRNDYAWSGRIEGSLPPSAIVLDRNAQSDPWRPWTYLFPVADRLLVIDRDVALRREDRPGLVLSEIAILPRHGEARRAQLLVDCNERRSAPLASPELPDDLDGLDWSPEEASPAVFAAFCENASGPRDGSANGSQIDSR